MSRLLTVPETAELLNTTERHIRQLVTDDRIPYTKVGRLIRIDQAALQAWLDAHTVRPPAAV